MNQNLKRKNSGITLVALVITIILLLILAGISIATLTGSGLFEKAKLAEQEAKNAQEKEDATLSDYENKIAQYIDGSRDNDNKYVQNEQAIGTWFNGKTIYRKIIDFTAAGNSSYNQETTIDSSGIYEEIIKTYGWIKNNADNTYYAIQTEGFTSIVLSNNNLNVVNGNSSLAINGRLVIEYTKVAD